MSKWRWPIVSLLLLGATYALHAQPAYRFLQDVRVNTDTPGRQSHFPGFNNSHGIARYQDDICILWSGSRGADGRAHVYLSRSTDGGLSFLPGVQVDSADGFDFWGYPSLLVDNPGGAIYAVWTEFRSQDYRLILARSIDGGASFGRYVRVDINGGDVPQIAALSIDEFGVIYCVWCAFLAPGLAYSSVYLARGTDGGLTFSSAVAVDSARNLHRAAPGISTDSSGGVFLTWRDDRPTGAYPYHIYCCRTTDGGNTFTPAVRADIPGQVSASFPSIAVDRFGQNIWIAHKQRTASGSYGIYVSRSEDAGQSFTDSDRLDSLGDADVPSIVWNGPDRLFAVWNDYRNGGRGDVYFGYSTDGGSTFSRGQRVNTPFNRGTNWAPQLAAGPGDTVYVCWPDYRNSDSADVYFARGVPESGGLTEGFSSMALAPELTVTPNPFGTNATLSYTLANAAPLIVSIRDIAGRTVRSLHAGLQSAGNYSLVWDGRDEAGRRAGAGWYLCVLRTGIHTVSRKLVRTE